MYDEYKQIYIGNTDNLKKRIRTHWTSVVPIERSLFPMYNVETSKISVRSFRALDNTRIYIAKDFQTYIKEDYYINKIDPTYILNRIQGGRIEKNSKVNILESAKINPTGHLELPEPPNSHPDLEMYEKIRANYEIEKAMKQAHYEDVMRSRENNALKKESENTYPNKISNESMSTYYSQSNPNNVKAKLFLLFVIILATYFLIKNLV